MENRRSSSAGGNPGSPQQPAFEPGEVLQGTYRILHALAMGGMGELYVAAHERLPGRYAIKVLHRDCLHDEEALSRFRCEAEIMSGLRHPNVVQVFDFNVTSEGVPYLAMELVEGRDLSEVLSDGRALPPLRVGNIVRQIASALEAAHARGVVHRDLKPENVMLLDLDGQEDFVKVVDFGISKARWFHRITADWTILGTPQFMSPEQAQGRRDEVDARTDQFALAAMVYTLLTGREPFRGDTAVAVLYQVVHQDPEPLSKMVDWPCARVDAVIARAMAKDREARFATVIEFSRALDQAFAEDLTGRVSVRGPKRRKDAAAPSAIELSRLDTLIDGSPVTKVRVPNNRRGGFLVTSFSALAVVSLAIYLNQFGWERVGSAVSGVYQGALSVTERTVDRWMSTPTPRPVHADVPIEAPILAPDAPAIEPTVAP